MIMWASTCYRLDLGDVPTWKTIFTSPLRRLTKNQYSRNTVKLPMTPGSEDCIEIEYQRNLSRHLQQPSFCFFLLRKREGRFTWIKYIPNISKLFYSRQGSWSNEYNQGSQLDALNYVTWTRPPQPWNIHNRLGHRKHLKVHRKQTQKTLKDT